jgi:hypothetical protein
VSPRSCCARRLAHRALGLGAAARGVEVGGELARFNGERVEQELGQVGTPPSWHCNVLASVPACWVCSSAAESRVMPA